MKLAEFSYERQLILAEGDYVIVHGRFTGKRRPAAWAAADVVRIEDGQHCHGNGDGAAAR
jgi:hypothetical protein